MSPTPTAATLGGGGPKRAGGVDAEQYDEHGGQPSRTHRMPSGFESCVGAGAGGEHDELERHAQAEVVPESQSELWRVVVEERKIRQVDDDVEQIVRDDHQAHDDRCLPVASRVSGGPRVVHDGRRDARADHPHEAVRDRVVDEVEREQWIAVGHDADVLPSDQEEAPPEQIGELGREEENSQRDLGLSPLDRQRDAVMSDEHSVRSSRRPATSHRPPQRWHR